MGEVDALMKLYISEYDNTTETRERGWTVAAPKEPALVVQTPVAISGTSAQSAAFNQYTRFVMVHADVICSIRFGEDPTATIDDARMVADETRFFGVRPGDRIAVISNT